MGVEGEEGLGHFDRLGMVIVALPTHLSFAGAGQAMGIDRQEAPGKVAGGAADVPQGALETLGFEDRMVVQEFMDGPIAGREGQAVEHLEAALAEGPLAADAGDAEGGFVDKLQGESGLHVIPGDPAPTAQKVPGSQAKMLGNQQPQADQVSADLVGQKLANPALEAAGITRFGFDSRGGALGLQSGTIDLRAIAIEFFFAGRIVR